ncbi:hypothetical protein ABZ671_31855 [Micromonospora sp. NPDC006766]|uniref:hypothetical protein n=1 Tax=Micromonospora sp. NPDC006766 TaxID=3154778 RepID=UPI0033C756FF
MVNDTTRLLGLDGLVAERVELVAAGVPVVDLATGCEQARRSARHRLVRDLAAAGHQNCGVETRPFCGREETGSSNLVGVCGSAEVSLWTLTDRCP